MPTRMPRSAVLRGLYYPLFRQSRHNVGNRHPVTRLPMQDPSLHVFDVPTYPGTRVLGGALAAAHVCQPHARLTLDDLPALVAHGPVDNDRDTPSFTPRP